MITATPGATITAEQGLILKRAPSGLLGTLTLGVREALTEVEFSAPSTEGIVEEALGGGFSNYGGARVAPLDTVTAFEVVWTNGETVVTEALLITGSPLPAGAPSWSPTVEDVAKVSTAYTRGGFDDDGQWAGSEQTTTPDQLPTFTDQTSPTRTHVEGLILSACEEVQGRVGVSLALKFHGLARATAKWHVAAGIAATKIPAGTDDASGEYRSHISNFRACLDELVLLARMGSTRLA